MASMTAVSGASGRIGAQQPHGALRVLEWRLGAATFARQAVDQLEGGDAL
nr:hypothetical protein [Janthinobacterium psychrotolerans]